MQGAGNYRYAGYAPNFTVFEDPALAATYGISISVTTSSGIPKPADTILFCDAKYVTALDPIPADYSPYCKAHGPGPTDVFTTTNFPANPLHSKTFNITWAYGHSKGIAANGFLTSTSISGCSLDDPNCYTYHLPCDMSGIPDGSASSWDGK